MVEAVGTRHMTDTTPVDQHGNDNDDEKQTLSREEARALASNIADQLDESQLKPRSQILNIVLLCGPETAEALLKDTLKIEAEGGLMIKSGTRRRTPGGVFFHLARQRLPEDIKQRIFLNWQFNAQKQAERESNFPVFSWDERQSILQDVLTHKGEASEVRVHITGRPGKIERRQNLVILTMENRIDPKLALPAGLPDPTGEPMTYIIYVSAKQWERVAVALEKPKDEFIIEGLCSYDHEIDGLAIFTTYITTRHMVRKEKQLAKKQNDAPEKKRKPEDTKTPAKVQQTSSSARSQKQKKTSKELVAAPKTQAIQVDIPADVPPQIAQKLTELYTAAASFQQKIAALEDKPAGQQHGLEMTQKLLKNTQRQIEVLEKQYTTSA